MPVDHKMLEWLSELVAIIGLWPATVLASAIFVSPHLFSLWSKRQLSLAYKGTLAEKEKQVQQIAKESARYRYLHFKLVLNMTDAQIAAADPDFNPANPPALPATPTALPPTPVVPLALTAGNTPAPAAVLPAPAPQALPAPAVTPAATLAPAAPTPSAPSNTQRSRKPKKQKEEELALITHGRGKQR